MRKKSKKSKSTPLSADIASDITDEFFREAQILHKDGDLESAAQLYIRSIERKPSAQAHMMLGRILVQFDELDGAIDECRIATKLDPDFGPAWNDLGLYLLQKRRYTEAGTTLERALKAKNFENREFPHFNLARIYIHQGMLIKATKELESAIKINPQFIPAKDFLHQVQGQLH